MKLKLSVIILAVALSACSSTKPSPGIEGGQITAINNQKLTSSFQRNTVKLEWECAWGTGAFGLTNAMCVKGEIKAIEVTAYATSNGNSENNRETAFNVAEMKAKAKLRHFIYEDVQSTSVTNTLTKNIEKANDRIKSKISSDEDVAMSDDEASKDTNYAIRENTNDIVRTVTENVRVSAQGILKGVYVKDEKVVDRQTVGVTIRWDKDSNRGSESLQKIFR